MSEADESGEFGPDKLRRTLSTTSMGMRALSPTVPDGKAAQAESLDFDKMRAVERERYLFEWSRDLFVSHYVFDESTGERRWYTSEDQRSQIDAWNNMADQMIKVVTTIKKNEERQASLLGTIRRVATVVWVAVLISVPIQVLASMQTVNRVDAVQTSLVASFGDMNRDQQDAQKLQQATLEAVNALATAMGSKLLADTRPDDAGKAATAKADALAAQAKALKATKVAATTPAEKATVERQLKRVEKKAAAAKKEAPKE